MATPEAPAASARSDRNHGMRIFLIWLPLAVIADILIWFVWKPHMPPGTMTTSAEHQQFDIAFMAMLCAPVLLFVWTYAAYALVTWHHRAGDETDGPPIHGNAKIQATWIGATAVIVLGLFVFGTVELIVPAGAGAGEGPAPIWKPSASHMLEVQVIGQQWAFTYRFPQFGGMETSQLVLPDNATVEHAGKPDILDVNHFTRKLRREIEARHGFTDDLVLFRILCLDVLGELEIVAFAFLFTNGKQSHGRIGVLEDRSRIHCAHQRELGQVGRFGVHVSAHIQENGRLGLARGGREYICQRRPVYAG